VELRANDEESGTDYSDSDAGKRKSSTTRRVSTFRSRRTIGLCSVAAAVLVIAVAAVCVVQSRSGDKSGFISGDSSSGSKANEEVDPRAGQTRPVIRPDAQPRTDNQEEAAATPSGSSCMAMAQAGAVCQAAVEWAKETGIFEHPEWYSSLSSGSSQEDFFLALAHQGHGGCSCADGGESTVTGGPTVPEDTMSTTMPCTDQESCLKIVDRFLNNQPRSYYFQGAAGLLQTFGANTQGGGNCGTLCHLPVECPSFDIHGWCRFDVYDNSLAAIYYTMRGKHDQAKMILDAFLELLYTNKEVPGNVTYGAYSKLPSGRMLTLLAAAYSPIKAEPGDYGLPGVADGAVDTGNNAWVAIAFARYAAATGNQCYALAARDIMTVLSNHQTCADPLMGFMARLKPFPNPTRSTEHNIDIWALARMLKNDDIRDRAQFFVSKMYGYSNNPEFQQAFATGSGCYVHSPSDATTPVDAQTWNILADAAADENHRKNAMRWALQPSQDSGMLFVDVDRMGNTHGLGKGDTWTGFRFSSFGRGVQGENTAAGVMSMVHFRDLFGVTDAVDVTTAVNAMRDDLKKMLATYGSVLSSIRGGNAMSHAGDHNPNAEYPGGSDTGFQWKYLRYPHLASTAWTGMMLILQADDSQTLNTNGNPYAVPDGYIADTNAAAQAQECLPSDPGGIRYVIPKPTPAPAPATN